MKRLAILFCSLSLWSGAVWADPPVPLRTVPQVDLTRYAGVWYEIARYPNRFQQECVAATATYTLRPDGELDVVNFCRDPRDGSTREATGRAWSVDPGNARLKVCFFWPFRGDYWIVDLGTDYEYAVVGHPQRKYLWIMSRTPQMDAALYARLLELVAREGYDPARLVRTPR